jgi:hypothetical protein
MLKSFLNRLTKSKEKHVSAFYGKVRIPTIGHKNVIDKVKEHAKKVGGDVKIGLSGADKPLSVEHKKGVAERTFGHHVDVGEKHTSNIVSYLSHLHNSGYAHLHLHAGSDRAGEYHKLLSNYNGKKDKKGNVPFNFKSFKVHTVGAERNEGTVSKHPTKMDHHELLKTASASRIEKLARVGDKPGFDAYHKHLPPKHRDKLYHAIRSE